MKKTPEVQIGNITIGGENPIVIQSMTNTDTADINATTAQIIELSEAGSELVRITVNSAEAAQAVPKIKEKLLAAGCNTPIIGDFHYNGHILLTKYPECAENLDKYRINPGNVGSEESQEYNFKTMVEVALKHGKPIRIGVNWGSLDQHLLNKLMDENAKSAKPKSDKKVLYEAIVRSTLNSAAEAEKLGLPKNKIVISAKMSDVQDVITVNRMLAERSEYAIHLGLTEAGMGDKGVVASTAALAILLQEKIGNTIRVSITPEPGKSRSKEVEICQLLLQTMGLRQFRPLVSSCPGCGRTESDYYQKLAKKVNDHIVTKMPEWSQKYPGVESLKIAVMGCVVNGPGESKHADIGISLPGKTENPIAPVYIDQEKHTVLKGETLVDDFITLLEKYIAKKYKK